MTEANDTTAGPADLSSTASSRLARELRIFSGETERYVHQMSLVHSMHRTDLSAISLIMDRGTASPKQISEDLALSPPATSALLDRLERAGHVRRLRGEHDRRSVRVEVTEQALEVGSSMFGLLARHMHDVFGAYSDDELDAAADLLRRLNAAAVSARAEAATM